MKRMVFFLVVLMLFLATTIANATTLTFDDISFSGVLENMPNPYGGLLWSNFGVINTFQEKAVYGVTGYYYGTVSPSNVAYDLYGNPASVSIASGTFTFNGAYFTAAWNNGLEIDVQGYKSGVLLDDMTITVDTTSPTYFTFNFTNIDTLTITPSGGTPAGYSGGGEEFGMDNFTYNSPISSVPEPCTMLLLGSGLAGLATYRRKFWKS